MDPSQTISPPHGAPPAMSQAGRAGREGKSRKGEEQDIWRGEQGSPGGGEQAALPHPGSAGWRGEGAPRQTRILLIKQM